MQYNEPRNIGMVAGIPPAVKFLLIINVAIFLIEGWFRIPLGNIFALRAGWYRSLAVGQLFTYMFVHANFTHLLVNMMGIFFIGPTVERTLGSYRFFTLYYLSGILGGLGWSLLAKYGACVGASGAVMGILGAFGALYPNAKVLLWFVIPVRAWILVLILAIWELSEILGDQKIGGIANAAHLMGGIAGYCYALSLLHPNIIADIKRKLGGKTKNTSTPRNSATSAVISKKEMDRILDKIGKEGMGSLTHQEREKLKRATRK